MTKLRYLVSLTTKDNDYQMEQAASARAAAAELNVDVEIVYAENDAITQSTQLLKVIQADPTLRPSAIVVEPLGATPFPKVASAAASAGIGWAVIYRQPEYTAQLRQAHRSPVFSVSADQQEIGRIQGRQIAALLPRGGSVLFVQGPSVSSVSRERSDGLRQTLPSNIKLVSLRRRAKNRASLGPCRPLVGYYHRAAQHGKSHRPHDPSSTIQNPSRGPYIYNP